MQLDCNMRILLMASKLVGFFVIRNSSFIANFWCNKSLYRVYQSFFTLRVYTSHPHRLAISEIISAETIINMKVCVTCQGNIEFFVPLLIFINSHIVLCCCGTLCVSLIARFLSVPDQHTLTGEAKEGM